MASARYKHVGWKYKCRIIKKVEKNDKSRRDGSSGGTGTSLRLYSALVESSLEVTPEFSCILNSNCLFVFRKIKQIPVFIATVSFLTNKWNFL